MIYLGYKSLDKLFDSYKENYEQIYNERYKIKYAVQLDFLIHDNSAKQIKALRDSLHQNTIEHFVIAR